MFFEMSLQKNFRSHIFGDFNFLILKILKHFIIFYLKKLKNILSNTDVQTFNMQCISMRGIDDDVVSDVSVYRHLVVLGRGIDGNTAGVVTEVVVSDSQQLRVLNVEVHHADRRVIEHAHAAVLDVVRLERNPWIEFTDVLKHEAASLVPSHLVVSDSL